MKTMCAGVLKLTSIVGLAALLTIQLAACQGSDSEQDAAESAAAREMEETAEAARQALFGETAGVDWLNMSFEDALAEAKKQNKLLLVDVWSDHCAQCGIMDEEVWATPDGVTLVGDALAIKVPSDAPESYDFRHQYPITGLPAVLLLDGDGNEINRVVGYQSKTSWMAEARQVMTGVDPLPDMEARVEQYPDDLTLYMPLMETYLYRAREDDARRIMDRVLVLDPNNNSRIAEKAIREMARFYAFFRMDSGGAADIWKTLVERFPSSSSINAALKGTLDHAKSNNSVGEWRTWVCEMAETHKDDGRFNNAVAMYAFRNQVKGKCLADAGRRAQSLGAAAANMDSVVTVLGS